MHGSQIGMQQVAEKRRQPLVPHPEPLAHSLAVCQVFLPRAGIPKVAEVLLEPNLRRAQRGQRLGMSNGLAVTADAKQSKTSHLHADAFQSLCANLPVPGRSICWHINSPLHPHPTCR